VFACDSYDASPGSHSRYLAGHFTTASPSGDPEQFAADVERIARENWIELVLPMFETLLVPAGRQEQLDFAVLAQLFQQPLREAPRTIHDLAKVHGTGRGWRDALPKLYSFLALARFERLSLSERKQLFVAMSDGITWDGQPIPGLPEEDAAYLARLTASPSTASTNTAAESTGNARSA